MQDNIVFLRHYFNSELMKSSSNQIDMLHGPLLSKILMFAIPLAASSVLQQLFNSIDIAVVGKFASSEALAAVGSNSPVISLLVNLFVGISVGANVIIANHIGQRDNQRIRDAVNTVTVLALFSGIILLFVGLLVARPILEAIDTPQNIIDLSTLYLRIYFLGMPFLMIYNFGAAVLRSMGDTKRPLYCLIIAGVINTILNLILVIGFDMSVAGVAIATVIANGVSAAMIVHLLIHEEGPFQLRWKETRIKKQELNKMLNIGIPAGLQGMVFSISNVVLQSAVNSFGSDAVAGSAAALNFEFYCYFMISAFDGVAVTFIGQNYGAGQTERCKKIFWMCMGLGVLSCGLLNILFFRQDRFFLNLFTSDPNVVSYGVIRMKVVLLTQWLACSYEIAGSALRGLGHSVLPAVLTIFGTCLLRLGWVYFVVPHYHQFDIVLLVYPISWIITGIMVCVAYVVITKKIFR